MGSHFYCKENPKLLKMDVTRNALHQHLVKKSDARKQTCIQWMLCVWSDMYWVETWHKWWGGYYKADHNTLYFSARNFLKLMGQQCMIFCVLSENGSNILGSIYIHVYHIPPHQPYYCFNYKFIANHHNFCCLITAQPAS